jgi:RimJ/RimL family protein N-acetyltransferase
MRFFDLGDLPRFPRLRDAVVDFMTMYGWQYRQASPDVALFCPNAANAKRSCSAELIEEGAASELLIRFFDQGVLNLKDSLLLEYVDDSAGQFAWDAANAICSRLIGYAIAPVGSAMRLRPATRADAITLFSWQADPNVRKYSRNPATPTLREHMTWLVATLRMRTRRLWIVEKSSSEMIFEPCGMLRLDQLSNHGHIVSIVISPHEQGKGLARTVLQMAQTLCPKCDLFAEIDPENYASVRAFEAAGFKQIGQRDYRWSAAQF